MGTNGNFTLFQPGGGGGGGTTPADLVSPKSFAVDISANNANITLIAFSGLQVGKLYNISANFAHLNTLNSLVNFTYVNGATVVLRAYSAPANGDTPFVSSQSVFSALSTTLTASLTLTGTGVVYGTNTLSFINRFILTEYNNTTLGAF